MEWGCKPIISIEDMDGLRTSPGVHARKPVPNDQGDDWLLWDPQAKVHRRVQLDEVPGSRAQRVRVQHLDIDMAGKREWTPSGRCVVPISLEEAYLATRKMWETVGRHRPPLAAVEIAYAVFNQTLDSEVADVFGNLARGILEVRDLDRLLALSGLGREPIAGVDETFVESGTTYAPWPVTLLVARELCRRYPKRMLEYVAHEEAALIQVYLSIARNASLTSLSTAGEREQKLVQAEADARRDFSHTRHTIATWCSGDVPDLGEEYLQLRSCYEELVAAVLPALGQFRGTKYASKVEERLRMLLGPVAAA